MHKPLDRCTVCLTFDLLSLCPSLGKPLTPTPPHICPLHALPHPPCFLEMILYCLDHPPCLPPYSNPICSVMCWCSQMVCVWYDTQLTYSCLELSGFIVSYPHPREGGPAETQISGFHHSVTHCCLDRNKCNIFRKKCLSESNL